MCGPYKPGLRVVRTPTTALREPENYGLRGSNSASHDPARAPPKVRNQAVGRGGSDERCPVAADALGTVLREHERHEAVEGPDGPLVAGLGDCLWRGRNEPGGIRRTGSAGALGIQAAGIRLACHGPHRVVP